MPDFTCGAAEIVVVKSIVTRPPITSVTAGGMPLYGTWIICTPAVRWKSSPARCGADPAPGEAKVSSPRFAFASAINSLTELAWKPGWTTMTFGCELSCVSGVKSFCGSYGSFL